MASKETMELLEQVLSESKAFRKYSNQAAAKVSKLETEWEKAKASGDKEGARKALKDLNDYNKTLAKYGFPYPTKNIFGGKAEEIYDKDMAKLAGDKYKERDKAFKMNTGSARPSKNLVGHSNINARTELMEAAQILIEALDILLND